MYLLLLAQQGHLANLCIERAGICILKSIICGVPSRMPDKENNAFIYSLYYQQTKKTYPK